MKKVLGIDVGGTGIKGGIVDLEKGTLISDRFKVETPPESSPDKILAVIKDLITHFKWKDKPIGIGFPAVIKDGFSLTASNINKDWIDYPIVKFLEKNLENPFVVLNDADAARNRYRFFYFQRRQTLT